jgi:hypothetical protein
MPRSAVEFGDDDYKPQSYAAPRALGASTRGTYEQRTAWYTKDMSGGAPLPYSKKSAGSVYRFDDDGGSAPTIKTSDKQ